MSNIDLLLSTASKELTSIIKKIKQQESINETDALYLLTQTPIASLGILATFVKNKLHGDKVFFNRNFHIEPTNVCVFSCKFCSYSKSYKHRDEGWEMSLEQMLHIVKKYDHQAVTEVHIVGGVHPKMDIHFFAELLRSIKIHRPSLHIKAFTAVELDYMFRKAKMSVAEGLLFLKDAGLNSIPGGGAEIFHASIRSQICADKVNAEGWLHIHQTAHENGIPSNATMLYGHIENYEHRIEHMQVLRNLQEKTKGFNTFIPLKFRKENNEMNHVGEVSLIEDMKMYAVARIFLTNIPHLKAYWPMLGRQNAQLTLNFGANDLDGTIDDSTKIYSMAGSEEQTPSISTDDLVRLIQESHYVAVERDTLYNEIKVYPRSDETASYMSK